MRVKPRRKHYTGSFQEDWFCLNKDRLGREDFFGVSFPTYSNVFANRNFKSLLQKKRVSWRKKLFRHFAAWKFPLPCQFISIALSDRLSRVYATAPFYHCISLVNSKTNDLTSRKSLPSSFSQTVFLGGWNKSRKNRMLSQANHIEINLGSFNN